MPILDTKNFEIRLLAMASVMLCVSIFVVFLLVDVSGESAITKIKCNELNCTVYVENEACFAKIDKIIGYDFQIVKCDKKHNTNETYFIAPCDVYDGGELKINCDKPNSDKSLKVAFSSVLLIFTSIMSFVSCCLFIYSGTLKSDTTTEPREMVSDSQINSQNDIQNSSQNEPRSDLYNETDSEHPAKNTGEKYTRFDKTV